MYFFWLIFFSEFLYVEFLYNLVFIYNFIIGQMYVGFEDIFDDILFKGKRV